MVTEKDIGDVILVYKCKTMECDTLIAKLETRKDHIRRMIRKPDVDSLNWDIELKSNKISLAREDTKRQCYVQFVHEIDELLDIV